ncbi:AIR synthase-related protein, partial [Helicobacter heilmannii]
MPNTLSLEDLQALSTHLNRPPSALERALVAALWSEHCSYRSSKAHLKDFGVDLDNSGGVVDLGGGLGAAFKIESHNHPSFLNPYEGAATGLGGVQRDLLSMGARPLACFALLRSAKTTPHHQEALAGFNDYAKHTHTQNLGCEGGFSEGFTHNVLVNAFCLGLVPLAQQVGSSARAGGVFVLLGRVAWGVGVDGACMSSKELQKEQRSSVPTGNPHLQAKLIDTCLEIYTDIGVLGAQDLGAGGLGVACVEMATRGGVGAILELENAPSVQDLDPLEILLNETQERMLLCLEPAKLEQALQVAQRHGLEAQVVGVATKERVLKALYQNQELATLPLPLKPPTTLLSTKQEPRLSPHEVELSSLPPFKIWLPQINKHLCLALASSTPAALQEPKEDSKNLCLQAAKELQGLGAKVLGFSDSINLGAMDGHGAWVLQQMCLGLKEARHVLGVPFVSGNVSLNNATANTPPIPPTLAIVAV